MDPTPEKDQSQEKKEGSLGQGTVNAINNLSIGRQGNPLGLGKIRVGSRLTIQAGSKIATFLFTTPSGWLTIGIIIVVFFTIIVLTAGFGGAPGAPTQEPIQVNAPIETPTPTLPAEF